MAAPTLPLGRWECCGDADSLAMPCDDVRTHALTTPGDIVANIKSQKKRNITNAKRAERNRAVRSELKTRVKAARSADSADSDEVRAAISRIDRAAAKGVIHANTAARKKARLMKSLQSS